MLDSRVTLNSLYLLKILYLSKDLNNVILYKYKKKAEIAQLVEQWIENSRVTSSTLVLGIYLSYSNKIRFENEASLLSNIKLIVPIGPFLCLAIIISVILSFFNSEDE